MHWYFVYMFAINVSQNSMMSILATLELLHFKNKESILTCCLLIVGKLFFITEVETYIQNFLIDTGN